MTRICVLAALLLAALPAAADDPVLRVRARMRVDLDAVERVPGGLVVRGSLRDDANDDPIAGHTVAISVEGDHGFYHYAEPSGPDGRFEWRVPLPLGAYQLRLGAGGDSDYAAAAAVARAIDVARRTPSLTLKLPERLPAAAERLRVVVEGEEADGLGPPRALDEEARAAVRVGERERLELVFHAGRAELEVPGPFGRAGSRLPVTVSVTGDELRNPAETTRTVKLTTTTTLTLQPADGGEAEVARDGRLALSGSLRDDAGPVVAAAVGVGLPDGPDLARAVTDAAGRFAVRLHGKDLPAGDIFVEARFLSLDEWRESASSPTLAVRVLPAAPITIWPYLMSPLLTALAGAFVVAVRNRRWRAWLMRRRAQRRRPDRDAPAPSAGGLTETRPRFLSQLIGRADHGLTGVVVDATDERPLATATVSARSAAGEGHTAEVDEHGRFALEGLPSGPILVTISAPGYVGEKFTRTLPHRGELRGARVRLIPVRVRIFAAWRRVSAPLLPSAKVADTMTPRELLAHVDSRRLLRDEPLVALTSLVEAAVWAARAPAGEELEEAERLAGQVTVPRAP